MTFTVEQFHLKSSLSCGIGEFNFFPLCSTRVLLPLGLQTGLGDDGFDDI